MNGAPENLEARLHAREARIERLANTWIQGPKSISYRAFVVAWGLAVVARATLIAGQGLPFLPHILLLGVAAAGLLRWGGRVFWLVSLLALLHPLWFLRDWLTQTTVMGLIALAGLLSTSAHADSLARRVAGPIVIATYFFAVFHKLNTGFLDPELSCAVYGWQKLGYLSHVPTYLLTSIHPVLPLTILALELAIFGLLWARPRFGAALAALFHIPLTIALAPAFAFVMLVGWVALLEESELVAARELLWDRWRTFIASLVAMSLVFILGGIASVAAFKSALLALVAYVLLRISPGGEQRDVSSPPSTRPWLAAVFVILYACNALLPYVGTQMQHSGAMLSNLRIDSGCWNHILVPESARLVEPYVRIDAAFVDRRPGEPVVDAEREQILRETLWSTTALQSMRRNWCPTPDRQIRLEGSFLGEPLLIESLCDPDEPLPRGPGSFGGVGFFDGYLRLQKNLARDCPTECVH